MDLVNFYNKSKKKLTDTVGGLGEVANNFRNSLSEGAHKTLDYARQSYKKAEQTKAPQWLQSIDSNLRKFSNKAENIPQFHYAEKINNPIGRFVAEIPQTVMNIPSKTSKATLGGYGKDYSLRNKEGRSNITKRVGQGIEVGLDAGSLIGGGVTAKNLIKEGSKAIAKPTIRQVAKEGFKTGVRQGAGYGAGYGITSGLQSEGSASEKIKQAFKNIPGSAATGAVVGGVAGGALPLIGHELSNVKKDVSVVAKPKTIIEKSKMYEPAGNPAVVDGKPQMKLKENAFQPKSVTFKLIQKLEGAPAGLSIKDVSKVSDKIAAKNLKAQQVVNRQIENQKKKLPLVEEGFINPSEVKTPNKQLELIPKKETKVNDVPFKGDEFSNDYKKITTPKDIIENKPLNRYQQAVYDKKVERSQELKSLLTGPTELRKIGYTKAEISRKGKDEIEKILQMSKLGYPKNEIQKMDFDRMNLIIERKVPWESLKNYYERKHALDTNYLEDIDPSTLKDINSMMTGNRDVYRNFQAVFGENFPKIKERLLNPFDQAKGNMFLEFKQWSDDINKNIVEKLGIKKGSNLSGYVQKWGENRLIRPLEESDIPDAIKLKMNLSEIKNLAEKTKGDWRVLAAEKLKEMPDEKKEIVLAQLKSIEPEKWQNVIEADKWFRSAYDRLLDELNAVREINFPTHPLYPESTKVIQKRNDYYRHFQEMSDTFAGIKNMFESPAAIDPSLAVASEYTKPKTKYLSLAQHRTGDKTDYDALGGFLDYLKASGYAKHIDPFIQKFRGVDAELKPQSGEFSHSIRGLSEELAQKFDPIYQMADLTDAAKIKRILTDYGLSGQQAEWMSKEMSAISDPAKIEDFIKTKLSKNKNVTLNDFIPAASAEKSENKLNNFLKHVDLFANDLAGKTNSMDRWVQDQIGRNNMKVISSINSRIKANSVLGNVASSVAQAGNVPQGLSDAGPVNSLKGMKDTIASIFSENTPMNKSSFIRERYFKAFNQFDTKLLEKSKNFAGWMTGVLDEAGTKLIWNSEYNKAISQKIADPIKFADDATRRMVAGRGIGEVPINQKAKMMQLVAPFQLEVQNLWYVFHDWKIKKELIPKLIQYSIYAYLFNSLAESIRGSRVTFDPINAGIEAYKSFNKDDSKVKGAEKAIGRMGGEILKNTMGGQTIANMYPENGFSIFGHELPDRKDLMGNGDPTRFGSGGISDIVTKGIQDPLYKIIPPFGGVQLKKTIEGTGSLIKGYADNAAGNVMTPVATTPENIFKGPLFGKSALSEVKDYYDNEGRPLSKEQTEKYKLIGNEYFDKVSNERKAASEKENLRKKNETVEATNLSDDISRLSDGKYYVKSLDRTFNSEKEANRELVVDAFKKSDKSFMEYEGKIYRKNEFGEVTPMSKNKYQSLLNVAHLSGFKKNDDFNGWIKKADEQYKLLNDLLLDPATDELEKAEIQNKIDTLIDDFQRFKEYGGFRKGKKGEEKYRYKLIDPEMMKVASLISGTTGKRPTISKKVLPLIRRRVPVVKRRIA